MLDEADERAARVRRALRRQRRRARRRPGSPRRWPSSQAIVELVSAARATTRTLRFAVDTADPANGALRRARQREARPRSRRSCSSSSSSGPRVDDERADELLGADGLDTSRHHLRTVRRYRPHLLSEPEEKILTEKAVTGRDAWTRLFERADERDPVELPGDEEPVHARRRAEPPAVARPRGAPHDRARPSPPRSSRACARAPTSSTRCCPGQGDRRPPARATRTGSRSRNLSNEASDESVAGAASRRCAPTTTCRSAGTG